MKRLLVCSTIVSAALLLLPAAAPAVPGPLHGQPAAAAAHAPAAFGLTPPQKAPLRGPLLGVLTGAATVTVNVSAYNGLADSAAVAAIVWGDEDFAATGTTDANGHVELSGVPAAEGNGEVLVYPTAGTTVYDLWGLSWPADGTTMGVRPGNVSMSIIRSGDQRWNYWTSVWVELTAVEANGSHYAGTEIAGTGVTVSGGAATITLGSETLDWGAIYYWANEGAELDVHDWPVSPGTTAGSLTPKEDEAQGVWVPGWGSGKPGTVTTLWFERFPVGWTNSVSGQATYPSTAAIKSFGTWTSQGAKYGKKVTIPSTVKPGYAYTFAVSHTDGPLVLKTQFQTCSLSPSKATISRGGAVRLSGIIPTEGHLGATPGKAKSVVIYKRTRSAGQPRYWDATRSGWTKVGIVKADRYGKYRSALLHPARSTWYVVRYPKDDWYWGAFTSVRKVTVR